MLRLRNLVACGLTAAWFSAWSAGPVAAQVGGIGGGGGNVQGQVAGGILVDAQGVVQPAFSKDKSEKLARQRMQAAAQKELSADVNKYSELRKVSLVRLEAACAETLICRGISN